MKKKYIIWDWNGTLLNDVELCIESINQLLAKEQLPILRDREAYQQIFRFPIIEYYRDAGFDFNKRSYHELASSYMEYYQPRSLSCHLHSGVKKTLQRFQKEGYTQVLLSASKKKFLLEQVALYDIHHFFDDILGLDDIHAHSKADLASEFANLQKENTASMVFVGDSVHDYEVSQKANADCVLIANGHEHKEKLLATGCLVLDDIEQILSTLIP